MRFCLGLIIKKENDYTQNQMYLLFQFYSFFRFMHTYAYMFYRFYQYLFLFSDMNFMYVHVLILCKPGNYVTEKKGRGYMLKPPF